MVATASKALADGLQEIIQKLGWSAAIRSERTRPTSLVRASGLIYKLGVCHTPYPQGAVSRIPYDGMVGHVSVPNGVTYVRRGKRPAWA